MSNLSNYPYPSYQSNVPAAGVTASLIGISLIAWIVQSIQSHFQPLRLNILLLLSHLTIFTELVLRAALPTDIRNSRAGFTAATVLFAVGQRMIILANYDFITRVGNIRPWISRTIIIGSMLGIIGSTILMAPAGTLSYSSDTIDQSFRLRQASAAIVLCMTILFYPIWFLIKIIKDMTKQAVILLIISSIACLVVSVFLLITSVPYYYIGASQQELWYYIFQFTPIAIALFTWTIFHPKRSLLSTQEQHIDTKENIETRL